MQSVILNQLTAIKWVNQELLKSSFNSCGIFSLAQNNIPQRNIDSRDGNIFEILDNRFSRNLNIIYVKLSLSLEICSIVFIEVEKYISWDNINFLYENQSKSSSGYRVPLYEITCLGSSLKFFGTLSKWSTFQDIVCVSIMSTFMIYSSK